MADSSQWRSRTTVDLRKDSAAWAEEQMGCCCWRGDTLLSTSRTLEMRLRDAGVFAARARRRDRRSWCSRGEGRRPGRDILSNQGSQSHAMHRTCKRNFDCKYQVMRRAHK